MMFVFCISLCLSTVEAPSQESPDQVARAIANAYGANRSAFLHGSIRFRIAEGYADDEAKATSNHWSKRHVGEGVYIFDGKLHRYDRIYSAQDEAAERKQIGQGVFSSLLNSIRLATNGSVTILDQVSYDAKGNLGHRVEVRPEWRSSRESSCFRSIWVGKARGRIGSTMTLPSP